MRKDLKEVKGAKGEGNATLRRQELYILLD